MTRGTTSSFSIAVTDAAGDPLDISTGTLTWTLRRYPGATAIITKTNDDGITVTDGPGGLATLTLDPADTSDFVDMTVRLIWGLDLTVGASIVTLVEGTLDVVPDVA